MSEIAVLDVAVSAARAPDAGARPRARQPENIGLAGRVGLWLDAWAMRSCHQHQNTHCWPAKMQTLHHIKTVRRP